MNELSDRAPAVADIATRLGRLSSSIVADASEGEKVMDAVKAEVGR